MGLPRGRPFAGPWLAALIFLAACSGKEFTPGSRSDAGTSGGGGAGAGGARGSGTDGATKNGDSGSAPGDAGGTQSGVVGTTALAASYDQRCVYDDDCTLVAEGDVCGCASCSNAAISGSSKAKWDTDRGAIRCTGPTSCPSGPACPALVASCADGTCTARAPVIITGASYEASCRADSDCKIIRTGEVCGSCACPAAVNLNGYAQYQKDVAAVKCTPAPSAACVCPASTAARCAFDSGQLVGVCALD